MAQSYENIVYVWQLNADSNRVQCKYRRWRAHTRIEEICGNSWSFFSLIINTQRTTEPEGFHRVEKSSAEAQKESADQGRLN